jgi:hypothetical protein
MVSLDCNCKNEILAQKDLILEKIEEYKRQVDGYIKDPTRSLKDFKTLHKTLSSEIHALKTKFDSLLEEDDQEHINHFSEFFENGRETDDFINAFSEIKHELDVVKGKFSKDNLVLQFEESYRNRCAEKIIKDKAEIFEKINDYKKEWNEWYETMTTGFDTHKKKIINDLSYIQGKLDAILHVDMRSADMKRVRQNVQDIKHEVRKVVAKQLIDLTSKDDRLCKEEETQDNQVCDTQYQEIHSLRHELSKVKELLHQNAYTRVEGMNRFKDTKGCYDLVQNFFAVNNIFFRKQEIIKRIAKIIKNNLHLLIPNEVSREKLRNDFGEMQWAIEKHIDFLDLKQYINSPYINYLKSKATASKVSTEFCNQLATIMEYWEQNKIEYRQQDVNLANIQENLSGDVRVYIRIKPLIGIEQKEKALVMQTLQNKKQKSVLAECPNLGSHTKQMFGDFYDIFEETFSNLDVYTGIETNTVSNSLYIDFNNIKRVSDTVGSGLYNTFDLVERGHSAVVIGIGATGSGKTFTLLGSKGVPGLLQYGLANMNGVKNIKVKHVFEQYVDFMNMSRSKMSGNIFNLVNAVPQLEKFSVDETELFGRRLSDKMINLNRLMINDLFTIINLIHEHRTKQGRLKKTPFAQSSSRSNLYLVVEITFDAGHTSIVTFIDTAGKDTPFDILETYTTIANVDFVDVMTKTETETKQMLEESKRDDNHSGAEILQLLKESLYINESMNHIMYFFEKRRNSHVQECELIKNPTSYSLTKYFVSPRAEETRINEGSNCLTVPLMKFIDSLSNKQTDEWHPAKYVVLCHVRQEEKYCGQSLDTLRFAERIKNA